MCWVVSSRCWLCYRHPSTNWVVRRVVFSKMVLYCCRFQVLKSAELVGYFVSADVWSKMVLDNVKMSQSSASLSVVAAVIRGSESTQLSRHLTDITVVIVDPSICHIADVRSLYSVSVCLCLSVCLSLFVCLFLSLSCTILWPQLCLYSSGYFTHQSLNGKKVKPPIAEKVATQYVGWWDLFLAILIGRGNIFAGYCWPCDVTNYNCS